MIRTSLPSAASVIGIVAIAVSFPALAEAKSTCHAVKTAEVAGFFDRWNAALATQKPSEVLKTYAADAVLLPTLANGPLRTQAERAQYFEGFLKKGPQGRIDTRTIRTGCNYAVDTGTYTFTFKDNSKVPARYTYVYEYHNGKWLIVSHHSSLMPEASEH